MTTAVHRTRTLKTKPADNTKPPAEQIPHDSVPMSDGIHFRCVRVRTALRRRIMEMHPDYAVKWAKLMRLGLPVLAPRIVNLESITAEERAGGWVLISKGIGHLAEGIAYPVRMRDGDDPPEGTPDDRPIIGHAVSGQNRGGDLWVLLVPLESGETETDDVFQRRCRESMQEHGVTPTVLYAPPEKAVVYVPTSP